MSREQLILCDICCAKQTDKQSQGWLNAHSEIYISIPLPSCNPLAPYATNNSKFQAAVIRHDDVCFLCRIKLARAVANVLEGISAPTKGTP